MNLATQYAMAAYQSDMSEAKKAEGLRETLKQRGHEKLLPRILMEYEKLIEREQRSKKYRTTTPEKEQTRILLELYQKLVQTHG